MALNSRLVFNETYYLAQNPDVKNAIGKVLDAAGTKFTSGLDHFTRAGAAEGRVATPLFNVDAYKANNPDLAEAGITTDAALRAHFYAYGAAEGRIALSTQVFNLDYYKANNQDLVDAGLTDAQIVRHFYEYGAAEGRQATVNFSVAAYKAANSDLAGLSDSVARAHWYTYGAGEGRAFPQLAQSFSVDPAAITVTEGNALTFTVTAALPVTAATSFTFNVTGDTNGGNLTATTATDFVGVTGTVTIAAGSSTATFTIT
ncbi:MAG: BACON domain-containing protein, partial [Niveispirillum sp.]|nr:BACON domain-containing protein [Niveispirillum sp.]